MASDYDRIKQQLATFIRRLIGFNVIKQVDYLGVFPSNVVSQNADGTLELRPDDTRLPPYSKVPIRYGVPGVTALVPNGARVDLGFEAGDPQRPIATVWIPASITKLTISSTMTWIGSDADASILRGEDTKTAYDLHTHQFVGVPPGVASVTLVSLVPLPTLCLATKGKVK